MKPIPVGKIGTRFILLRTLRAQQRAYVIGHTPAACQGRARYENVVRIRGAFEKSDFVSACMFCCVIMRNFS